MVSIKGTAILETINLIKSRAGEDALQKILALLDEDARALFKSQIFASTWYPLDPFARFLEVEIRVLADGKEEVVTRGAELATERQLRGIYKAFVKLGSPEFVIKRIAAVHATYFEGVPIEVKIVGHGQAVVTYTGFEKQHRLMGFVIIGFFKKALEVSGAKNVAVRFNIPIEAGKGYADLSISWN
jgi:alkanesulfonate monooxygenase SsuD/methylene tetrahydromethanopterin reductase-like flavin-dependent oxidoreductase (luciferase family)